jgi:sugar/nucleoside kinase (ribokinase family)
MTNVLVIGSVAYNTMIYLNRFPEPHPQTVFSKDYHETLGGTAAGKALNLHKLDLDVTLYSLIGDDLQGERIRQRLTEEDIPFDYAIDPAGTQRHVNLMNAEGQRISIWLEGGTFQPEVAHVALAPLIPHHEVVSLDIVNYCRAFIPLLQRQHKEIWCDLHDYDGKNPYHQDFIDAADVIFMSSEQISNPRPFMEAQIERGKQLVVCTHGKDGATAIDADGHWYEQPIIDAYSLHDSNGAGDAFFAGFFYAYAQGYTTSACLQRGTIAAGLCITAQELAHPDLSPTLLEKEWNQHFRLRS